jgi:hypothetical protein
VCSTPIDIGSTAHVMSVDVVEYILKHSHTLTTVSFPHPKWLILAKMYGAKIQSVEVGHLLTFETPEQFRKQVIEELKKNHMQITREKLLSIQAPEHPQTHTKSEGVEILANTITEITAEELENDYALLQKAYESTIGQQQNTSTSEWRLRYRTLRQYLEILLENISVFGLDTSRQESIEQSIKETLPLVRSQEAAIIHVLRRTTKDVHIVLSEHVVNNAHSDV